MQSNNNHKNEIPKLNLIHPSNVTPSILSQIIASAYHHDHHSTPTTIIKSLIMKSIEEGVLSEVVEINVIYKNKEQEEEEDLPKSFIAKFIRQSLPQPHMFQIEASFYKMQQQQSSSSTTTTTTTTLPPLPFHLAKMIYSSSHCIILEKIEHVQSFPLVHGCPTLSIRECMIRNLALMHARYWQTTAAATTTTTTADMQTFWKSLSSTP
eukprot:5821379-Ditylum_brightwellii.AAC.1